MNRSSPEITFTPVIEGFDWGPAVSKIILNFTVPIDASSCRPDFFRVTSLRSFPKFDFNAFRMTGEKTTTETLRPVNRCYPSDSSGNPSKDNNGEFLTLEMTVDPRQPESSPFFYNMENFHNEFAGLSHKIEIIPDAAILSPSGKPIEIPGSFREKKSLWPISDEFTHNRAFSHKGIDLLYADFHPKPVTKATSKTTGSRPLIIWLHGLGEGGKDTRIIPTGNRVVRLATDPIQSFFGENGASILIPQCPTMWMDFDGTATYTHTVRGSKGKSCYTEALAALIQNYLSEHPETDRNRIYIGGCSNGGYMTINMLLTLPNLFAGAFPVCEGYAQQWLSSKDIALLKKTHLWLTHAEPDTTVPIAKGKQGKFIGDYKIRYNRKGEPVMRNQFSNALYKSLNSAGSQKVFYSRLKNVPDSSGLYKTEDGSPFLYDPHWSWIPVLNNELEQIIDGERLTIFEWLARQ